MSKITYTAIRKALTECAFDPRKPGPMAVIADTATPDYATRRAAEFLNTAWKDKREHKILIQRAVGLLGFILAIYEADDAKESKKRKTKANPNSENAKKPLVSDIGSGSNII